MRFLNEIRESETVVEHYLCKSKQTLKSRAGKSYLSLKLQDKTGVIDAKVWELTNDIQSFEENDFIKVEALVLTYQNDLQMNIKKIRKSNEGEYHPMDYIPSSGKNIDEMYDKFIGYIDVVEDVYLKALLKGIFIDNKTIAGNIKIHSAAKSVHHNYLGGLLEHSLSVTETCEFLSTRYKHVDKDILLTSAMLHDVGKVMELSTFPVNDYTDEGQLLGHIYMAAELISKTASGIDNFPKVLENLVKHNILSHHGELEFGSPTVPKTIESFIIHYADNLDAKIKIIEDMLDTGENTFGSWVGYNKLLQRQIRKSEF